MNDAKGRITMPDYLSLKAFSGGLGNRILTVSPYHAWWASPWNPDYRQDNSKPADTGTAAHSILLEGDESCLAVIEPTEHRSKPTKADPEGAIPSGWTNGAMRAARDAAYAEGKTPILPSGLAAIREMVEAAHLFLEKSELAGIFTGGQSEATVVWDENGVPCKARPDWLNLERKVNLSYKTTMGSANPEAWIRKQLPDYSMGMALYERGIKAAHGVDVRTIHLVQEQERPYACSLVALDPAYQAVAESRLQLALSIWRDCLANKRFPAYPTNICYAQPSPWQLAELEAQ